jgi:hypothetical protein
LAGVQWGCSSEVQRGWQLGTEVISLSLSANTPGSSIRAPLGRAAAAAAGDWPVLSPPPPRKSKALTLEGGVGGTSAASAPAHPAMLSAPNISAG